ncbi:MAG: peroxidase-related enzyme [Pseudomonadota bacterium]
MTGHVAPPDTIDSDSQQILALAEAVMGFTPNSMLVMAHRPTLLQGFAQLMQSVYGPTSTLAPDLRQLIAYAVSSAAGCLYCQAHTAHGAHRAKVDETKLAEIINYPESTLYSDAEKAVLDLAFASGQHPNAATEEHFAELRKHFSEPEIVDIVSVIAMFGFLNRWNDTLATPLEANPREFGERVLQSSGWQPGKHATG